MEQKFHSHDPAPTQKAGGHDPRVVEHHDVAALQQARQGADVVIGKARGFNMQKARALAGDRRPRGNTVGWQIEIEEINAHCIYGLVA